MKTSDRFFYGFVSRLVFLVQFFCDKGRQKGSGEEGAASLGEEGAARSFIGRAGILVGVRVCARRV